MFYRNRVLVKQDINTENQFMLRPNKMAGNRFLTNPDNSTGNQFSYQLDGATKYLVSLNGERKKFRPATFFIFDRNQTQIRKFQFKIVKNGKMPLFLATFFYFLSKKSFFFPGIFMFVPNNFFSFF